MKIIRAKVPLPMVPLKNFPGSNHYFSTRKVSHAAKSNAKSFNDIPSREGILPASLHLMKSGGPGYLHEHCHKRHAELGPIFKERLGSTELVFIADTKMIQTVIANEGARPHHNVPEAWTLYNQVKGIERGLFFQVGEPWFKLRHAFNKVMLADAHKVTRFATDILKVNSDLFDWWQTIENRQSLGGKILIDDVKYELCKWSIEATGLMLFGCRMGCIPSEPRKAGEDRADKLVSYVAAMFSETSKFQVLPVRLAQLLNLSTWRKFEIASDGMLKLANEYASECIAKAKETGESRSLLRDLIDLDDLDDTEITRSMVDLIIAAADTTSNSLQWMLYILAKYPEVQEKLRAEVLSSGQDLDAFKNIKQSYPYLNAFVKEVSRLYPTAPFLARTLDHSISLGGYTLPAGVPIVFSLYTTSRMSEYFEDPLTFKPERWLRKNSGNQSKVTYTNSHAYATLPFGVGARMCIGRRLADLEMHLLLVSFVTRFKALPVGSEDVKVKLKMILGPNRPIKLRLLPRLKG